MMKTALAGWMMTCRIIGAGQISMRSANCELDLDVHFDHFVGTNPEAFAGCYVPETAKWNPDGTALYLQATLYSPDLTSGPGSTRWNSASRLQILSRSGLLPEWTISQQPEIVYTGSTTEMLGEPWGLSTRPTSVTWPDDLILEGVCRRISISQSPATVV